jgi:hypothetical protein
MIVPCYKVNTYKKNLSRKITVHSLAPVSVSLGLVNTLRLVWRGRLSMSQAYMRLLVTGGREYPIYEAVKSSAVEDFIDWGL